MNFSQVNLLKLNPPFIMAILAIGVFLYGNFWIFFGLMLLSCLALNHRDLLALSLYASFFNAAFLDYSPVWAGMCGSILVVFCASLKLFSKKITLNNKGGLIFFCGFVFLLFLTMRFFLYDIDSYYARTGLKSYLQQLIFVLLFFLFVFMSRDESNKYYLEYTISKYVPFFLAAYSVVFFLSEINSNELGFNRFGGALGPQGLAFSLALLACYYFKDNNLLAALLVIGITVLTGSRTYLLIQLFLMVLFFLSKDIQLINKFFYGVIGVILLMLFVVVMPLLSERLNYYSPDFFGTFIGRIKGYREAVNLFLDSPFFGGGLGSFVLTLKAWSMEGYIYYLLSGDTTVVHNEYLRIVVESGIVGLFFYVLFIIAVARFFKGISIWLLLIFAVGSLVENTLSLYSGPVVALIILIWTKSENNASKSFDCK